MAKTTFPLVGSTAPPEIVEETKQAVDKYGMPSAMAVSKARAETSPDDTSDVVTPTTNRYTEESEKFFGQFAVPDEAAIREAKRQEAQGSIDAINKIYTEGIAKAEEQGKEFVGTKRALSARSGTLTSSLGLSSVEGAKERVRGEVRGIQGEQALRIENVLEKASIRADEAIRLKRNEALTGQGQYLNYLKSVQDETRSDVKEMAESGQDLDRFKNAAYEGDAKGSVYNQFLEETGWNSLQFDSMWEAGKPPEEQVTYTPYWKGDNLIMVGQDPVTGKVKTQSYSGGELGIPVGADIETSLNKETGEMFWWDWNDKDENGNPKVKSLGAVSTPEGAAGIDGSLTIVNQTTGEEFDLFAVGGISKAADYLTAQGQDAYSFLKQWLDINAPDLTISSIDSMLEGAGIQPQGGATLTQDYFTKLYTTQTQIEDGMRDTFTEDELNKMADAAGFGSFWDLKSTEIKKYLQSDQAKQDYINYIMETVSTLRTQYTDEEILKLMQ